MQFPVVRSRTAGFCVLGEGDAVNLGVTPDEARTILLPQGAT